MAESSRCQGLEALEKLAWAEKLQVTWHRNGQCTPYWIICRYLYYIRNIEHLTHRNCIYIHGGLDKHLACGFATSCWHLAFIKVSETFKAESDHPSQWHFRKEFRDQRYFSKCVSETSDRVRKCNPDTLPPAIIPFASMEASSDVLKTRLVTSPTTNLAWMPQFSSGH